MTSQFISDLQKSLGPAQVLASPADLLLYSYDAALDRELPAAVVLPRDAEEVSRAVRIARAASVPFVARGAGTNLCGGSVPAPGGLVIHLARLNRILEIDPARRRAWVEPGVVNLHLQKALAPHGLFYPPDPASQKACTLGGNVGTNAGGPHCLKYGVTTNHVAGLEVVLPDGDVAEFSVQDGGPDITGLFVGGEGTLGLAVKIQLNLLPLPEDVQTFLVSFPSMESAAQAVTDIISSGIVPATLEVMDRLTVQAVEAFVHAGYPADAEAVLLIETDGPRGKTAPESLRIRELCGKNGGRDFRQAGTEAERQKLWEGRRGSYPAMARLAPNVLVEDGVVPRSRLPEAVRRIRAIADREKLRMGLIAHAGDGNLHPNMVFDERDPEETRRVKAAGYEMLKVCVELGGSVSGEHGIGRDKREAMRWLFTPETLRCFRRIKEAFDPANLCNPDKLIPVVDPPAPDRRPPAQAPAGDRAQPRTLQDLQELLRWAQARGRRVAFRGLGTKGLPPPPGAFLADLPELSQILDHDRANFTLTVQGGATVQSVRDLLAPAGQHLHVSGPGTLGGIISANACRRPRLRDQILGLKAVLPGGRIVEFGGKVMKNVAGYDAAKLFIGAWGTLGAVVEVTFRLWPFPPEEEKTSVDKDFSWLQSPLVTRLRKAFDPDGLLAPL